MKPAEFVIRDAEAADCRSLTGIATRAKAHWGYDHQFMEDCREELEVSPADISRDWVRVGISEGMAVGFSHVARDQEEGVFEVDALFVDPPFIGSGLGRMLWVDLLETLRNLEAKALLVQSDPNAEGFYLAMGMQRTGSRESDSISGRMLPMLELHL